MNKSVVCGSLPLGCDTPNEADFLYASSCVPGYISWTNTSSGSGFITALCNVLLSYWPNMHLGQRASGGAGGRGRGKREQGGGWRPADLEEPRATSSHADS